MGKDQVIFCLKSVSFWLDSSFFLYHKHSFSFSLICEEGKD